MRPAFAPDLAILVRPALAADTDALADLENCVFPTDRISRRGFRRFVRSPSAELIVVESGSELAGYALVLFRKDTPAARLYSIAVDPQMAGRRIGMTLLAAAEQAAAKRGCAFLRLEAGERNVPALALYEKSGYRQFGRHIRYYEDGSNALRLEKPLLVT
jgi:ribosomal protein S18 acetylase RimI-like enzyme